MSILLSLHMPFFKHLRQVFLGAPALHPCSFHSWHAGEVRHSLALCMALRAPLQKWGLELCSTETMRLVCCNTPDLVKKNGGLDIPSSTLHCTHTKQVRPNSVLEQASLPHA